jgi:hypothetical protein
VINVNGRHKPRIVNNIHITFFIHKKCECELVSRITKNVNVINFCFMWTIVTNPEFVNTIHFVIFIHNFYKWNESSHITKNVNVIIIDSQKMWMWL